MSVGAGTSGLASASYGGSSGGGVSYGSSTGGGMVKIDWKSNGKDFD